MNTLQTEQYQQVIDILQKMIEWMRSNNKNYSHSELEKKYKFWANNDILRNLQGCIISNFRY